LKRVKKKIVLLPKSLRVPKEYLVPKDLVWPKHPVSITLKNLGDHYVEFQYPEDGVAKTGILAPRQIGPKPTAFIVNVPYLFSIRCGRKTVPTSRTFIHEQDWDLAIYFD